jgi:hypothetical protein
MKYVYIYAFFFLFTYGSSFGQSRLDSPKRTLNSETKFKVTSPKSNQTPIFSKYQYTDSTGARLMIQNSFPRSGIKYTDPKGKQYVYAVFWTRITNETVKPFELKIEFPLDSFELPSSLGNHIKLLLPSDTMTFDKEAMYDYGLAIKSFLDKGIYKSYLLKRTIDPKQSTGFYVVTLSNRGVNGPLRTELYVKEQNLFYRINDKEIIVGRLSK